jgi:hypothetical protein
VPRRYRCGTSQATGENGENFGAVDVTVDVAVDVVDQTVTGPGPRSGYTLRP